MVKKCVLLALVLSIIAGLIGCSSGGGKSSISGTYICTKGSEYGNFSVGDELELNKNGDAYAHTPGQPGASGTWKVDGDKITITFEELFGLTYRGKIAGNTIIFDDGSTLNKKGGEGTSSISGTYTCIQGSTSTQGLMGTQDYSVDDKIDLNKDGTLYGHGNPGITGKWKVDGDDIYLIFDIFGTNLTWKGQIHGDKINLDDGSIWTKGTLNSSNDEIGSEDKSSSNSMKSIQVTKADLVNALNELKDAILEKIQTENRLVAQTFTEVKDYWHSKRWADFARVPLRSIENTLSALSAFDDIWNFMSGANAVIYGAKSFSDVLTTWMAVHEAGEIQNKFQIALNGPEYKDLIEEMLNAADDSIPIPFGIEFPLDDNWKLSYQIIIENHLSGANTSPLVIRRTSQTEERTAVSLVYGTLDVQRSIIQSFNNLISEIEKVGITSDVPLDIIVTQLKDLRHDIILSKNGNTEINFTNYKGQPETITIGAIREWLNAKVTVATALAKNLKVEMGVEISKALKSCSIVISVACPGVKAAADVFSQTMTLSGIMLDSQKQRNFPTDPEEAFYMIPQEMMLMLPSELSNLWMIVDDTDYYLRTTLKLPITIQSNTSTTTTKITTPKPQPTPQITNAWQIGSIIPSLKNPSNEIKNMLDNLVKAGNEINASGDINGIGIGWQFWAHEGNISGIVDKVNGMIDQNLWILWCETVEEAKIIAPIAKQQGILMVTSGLSDDIVSLGKPWFVNVNNGVLDGYSLMYQIKRIIEESGITGDLLKIKEERLLLQETANKLFSSGSIMSNNTHILAVADPRYQNIGDLSRQRILVACPPQHGEWLITALSAYGIYQDKVEIVSIASTDYAKSLNIGMVDAVLIDNHPSSSITQAIIDGSVRLLPWSLDAIGAVVNAFPGDVVSSTLPSGTYKGQNNPIDGYAPLSIGDNLIPNPSFEVGKSSVGPDGWVYTSDNVDDFQGIANHNWVNNDSHFGLKSIQISYPRGYCFLAWRTNDFIEVDTNSIYKMSVYAKGINSSGNLEAYLQISFYRSNNSCISAGRIPLVYNSSSWTFNTKENIHIPSEATKVRLYCCLANSDGDNISDNIMFDDVYFGK